MENITQLIVRNQARFVKPGLLLINPPRDSGFRELGTAERTVRLFTQDFGDFDWFRASGAKVDFGLIPDPPNARTDCVFIQPREKNRLDMMLHYLSAHLPDTNPLWLAGENRTGIKSTGKNLKKRFNSVQKVDNARHCVLLRAAHAVGAEPFNLEHYLTESQPSPPNDALRILSLPGTFAHGRVDAGTQLLLEAIQEIQPTGNILDFACGNGIISLAILSQGDSSRLTLLDTSAIALESSRATLTANHVEAELLASDGLSQVTGTYDWIVSNPPFHRGVRNDLQIAKQFFSQAGNHLTKKGRMLLVYNHHLPYQTWLSDYFKQVEIIKVNNAFRVALVHGARS